MYVWIWYKVAYRHPRRILSHDTRLEITTELREMMRCCLLWPRIFNKTWECYHHLRRNLLGTWYFNLQKVFTVNLKFSTILLTFYSNYSSTAKCLSTFIPFDTAYIQNSKSLPSNAVFLWRCSKDSAQCAPILLCSKWGPTVQTELPKHGLSQDLTD
jgi:hypothetical protein